MRGQTASQRRHRCRVDDRATLSLLDHHPSGVFGAEEDAADQNGVGEVPIVDGDLRQGTEGAAQAGIVPHDVESPELVGGATDHPLGVAFAGDVGVDEARAAPLPGGIEFFQEAPAVLFVEVRDHDLGAFGEEALDTGAAHPAGSTGHDGNFVLEPLAHGDLLFSSILLLGRGSLRTPSSSSSFPAIPYLTPRI